MQTWLSPEARAEGAMPTHSRARSHLSGVSWHSPPAQQSEGGSREGHRLCSSLLPLWVDIHPAGVGRAAKERPGGQKVSPGIEREAQQGDGRGCTFRADSGGKLEKVTGLCLTSTQDHSGRLREGGTRDVTLFLPLSPAAT